MKYRVGKFSYIFCKSYELFDKGYGDFSSSLAIIDFLLCRHFESTYAITLIGQCTKVPLVQPALLNDRLLLGRKEHLSRFFDIHS